MRTKLFIAVTGLLTLPAYAAELQVEVEIPRINVAEYHRPYVAIWLEGADQKVAANLAVWYLMKTPPTARAPSGCPTCANGGVGRVAPCRCRWMA